MSLQTCGKDPGAFIRLPDVLPEAGNMLRLACGQEPGVRWDMQPLTRFLGPECPRRGGGGGGEGHGVSHF